MDTKNRFKLARTDFNKNGPQSVKKVSDETGITRSLIDDLETDVGKQRGVSYLIVGKLADYYGVSADYLLGLSDTPSKDASIQSVNRITGLDEAAILSIKYIREHNPEYINVLSSLLHDGNIEYLLYLIHKRFIQAIEPPVKPIVKLINGQYHIMNAQKYMDSLKRREIKIQFDGATILAQKEGLLDSLISSVFQNIIKTTSNEYRDSNGGANNAKH